MPVQGNHNYPGVYVEELPSGVHTIQGVPTAITVIIGPTLQGPLNLPVQVLNMRGYKDSFGDLAPHLETSFALSQFFLNGGSEAWVMRVPEQPDLSQIQQALLALDKVDLFNLLVLPGVTAPAMVEAAARYCAERRAFLIVDAPASAQSPSQLGPTVANLGGAAKRNAALYYPWIKITNPLDPTQPRLSPPSGTVAGIYARTDANRGVWKAPAGTEATLMNVEALAYNLTDAENGQLTPIAINCLRDFPIFGKVCWGARTLSGTDQLADEWKYVPVRRLGLFLTESIYRGTKWVVFEPNDEPLWAQIRLNIGAFLHTLFRLGAFQGQSPKEAYFVKCDRETTTADDINHGVVNVIVGFAPLKPAEFIIIHIRQLAGDIST